MPRVRVLRPHANPIGIGVFRVGDIYEESPLSAEQKVNAGFVEYVEGGEPSVRTKEDPDMYRTRSFSVPAASEPRPEVENTQGVQLQDKTGNWYTFTDDENQLAEALDGDSDSE